MCKKIDKKKREKIIEISRNIFSRFGMKKSTMDDIAKKIRMGKSTLYYYFRNKEEIFLEVVKKESETLKKKLIEELKKVQTPQDKFRTYSKMRMKHLKELSNYYATLTDDYFDIYSFAEETKRDFSYFEIRTLKGIFDEGNKKGIFQIKNTEITANMVTIAFKGFEYLLITKEQKPDVIKELDLLIDVFFKGIEKR